MLYRETELLAMTLLPDTADLFLFPLIHMFRLL
jgi:hypothetical protein